MTWSFGPGYAIFREDEAAEPPEWSVSPVPLAVGVAFAVREWARFSRRNVAEGRARFSRRNVAEGRARFDDGKLYFCGGFVPRYQTESYYVAEQKRREVERAAR